MDKPPYPRLKSRVCGGRLINVRFVLEKERNGDTGRYWFYATGGFDVQEALSRNLGEKLVNATAGSCGLQWDEKEIMRLTGNGA